MATPYKFVFGPQDLGIFHKGGYNEAAAEKLGELLQQNLENWHIIYMGLRHSKIFTVLSYYFPLLFPSLFGGLWLRALIQKCRFRPHSSLPLFGICFRGNGGRAPSDL